ncbi:MAG TPA: hypothetical protein DCQ30_03835 [Acidimicrobiaceae bacterium]|nr:hypothetical protein [Acidimicrobiaceae bacterium]
MRIGAALGLPVAAAGAVIGALALAGPSDAAHGPSSHVLTPTAATNSTTTVVAPPAPTPDPATAANSSPASSTTTTVAPSPPAPAIGAPANSACGGVCGPDNSGTTSSSGNGQ